MNVQEMVCIHGGDYEFMVFEEGTAYPCVMETKNIGCIIFRSLGERYGAANVKLKENGETYTILSPTGRLIDHLEFQLKSTGNLII